MYMPCGLHNSNLEVREWEKGKSRRKRYAALKPYTAHGPYATHGDKKGRHESGTLFIYSNISLILAIYSLVRISATP